jgi:ABC-type glycerol-3-phosphate transport system substrate-binding protein
LLLASPLVLMAGGGQEKAAGGKVTLKSIHYAGGGHDFWNATVKNYMTEFPNIIVEEEIVQPGQYHQKLGGYVTAGSGPDLLLMEAGLSTIKYKDVLIDMKASFADALRGILGYDVYFNDFDSSKELLAIPTASNGHMVYYNKKVFQAAGLDTEKPPTNWSGFDKAVKAIRAAGKEPIALGAKEYGIYWLWSALLNQTMTHDDHVAMFRGTNKWEGGKVASVVYLLDDMYKRGWFNKGAAMTTVTPEAQDMFINGDAAFFVSLLGDAFNWKIWGEAMGYDNFGVMKLPKIEKDFPLKGVSPGPIADTIPVWGSYAFGIAKWSKSSKQAAAYIKYLLRADVQKRFVLEGGFFPNSLKGFPVDAVKAPQFGTLVKWASETKAVPGLFYNSPEEWDGFVRNSQLLFTDQITAADYLKDMQRIQAERTK